MKISIITWDASFRESYHTAECFRDQSFSNSDYEFIWVDYYSKNTPELKMLFENNDNMHHLNMGNDLSHDWHLGKCINHGINHAKGEILLVIDGDIFVDSDFLDAIYNDISDDDNQICYFRRWDEKPGLNINRSLTIENMEKNAILNNPTNYAGCFSIYMNTFSDIGYFDEHEAFNGPGMNGMEQYIRFRNKGLSIKWHSKKIYHPYHSNTGYSDKSKEVLKKLALEHPWIKPYAGLEQSWIIKNREIDLTWKANDGSIQNYLLNLPSINSLKKRKKFRL